MIIRRCPKHLDYIVSLEGELIYCIICGSRLVEAEYPKCPRCGKDIYTSWARFCPWCGQEF